MTDLKEKLYPELTEKGKSEAEAVVKMILEKVKEGLDNSNFYCDIPCFIESDSWQNYRNSIIEGMNDYSTGREADLYDYKTVRKVMLKENYAEIIKDLDQDNLEKIKELEATIRMLRKHRYY